MAINYNTTNIPGFDAIRRRQAQLANTRKQEAQTALDRNFASQNRLGSGLHLKLQAQQARELGTQEANDVAQLDLAEEAEKARRAELAQQVGMQERQMNLANRQQNVAEREYQSNLRTQFVNSVLASKAANVGIPEYIYAHLTDTLGKLGLDIRQFGETPVVVPAGG